MKKSFVVSKSAIRSYNDNGDYNLFMQELTSSVANNSSNYQLYVDKKLNIISELINEANALKDDLKRLEFVRKLIQFKQFLNTDLSPNYIKVNINNYVSNTVFWDELINSNQVQIILACNSLCRPDDKRLNCVQLFSNN